VAAPLFCDVPVRGSGPDVAFDAVAPVPPMPPIPVFTPEFCREPPLLGVLAASLRPLDVPALLVLRLLLRSSFRLLFRVAITRSPS
jgi:hypothetical protein